MQSEEFEDVILFMRFSQNRRAALSAVFAALMIVIASCDRQENHARPQLQRAPVELAARVDRASVNPGDIITLTITANYAKGVSLALPDIAGKLGDFRIVGSSASPSDVPPASGKDNRFVAERWYKLQADLAGSYIIEPAEVACVLPGGEQKVLKTPKIFIEVISLLGKEGEAKDVRDIKSPLSVPPSYRVFLLIFAILGGVILLILLIRQLLSWLRQRADARKLISKPAHEEALEALDRLLKKRLIEKGRTREFCFEISEIFRRYMQARFDMPALDWTTDEIIPHIEESGLIERDLRPLVRGFLTDTDIVKFARHQPLRDDMERIVEHTRTFINRTKPVQTAGEAAESSRKGAAISAEAGGEAR